MKTMTTERMALARLPPIGSPTIPHPPPGGAGVKYDGLTGPSYSLSTSDTKYNLPPPKVLKPYQDTKAGSVETWPAHASGNAGSSISVGLTRNKELVVMNDEEKGKPRVIPKPRFLEQLESFLKKEIRALGVTAVQPDDLRLQIHREVFEYLIEDFKTYKPLLSAIKNEYEMMLTYQREQIRQMEPLKQMLVTVSEQCDQKIMNIREQEKQDIVDLKKENLRLYRRIDELKQEQRSLETQVHKLQEELATEYLRYRDECDARKLLVADINDLRYQQEDIEMSRQSMAELDEEKDDPITLRIALRKAREDEASATKRLNEMIANYGDVIPRRDFEALQKSFKDLDAKMAIGKRDFQTLKDEHNALLDVHKQVIQQRDDFYVECETLRRSATPRPEWNKCADFVAGGSMRWKELSEGKTSGELMDVLLAEIAGGGGAETGGAEYFDGYGTGANIPKYLQHDGRVRNRRLGKRDCALLIKDIWREKGAHDAEKTDGKRETLADFLHIYLKRRFGLDKMILEWAYNLHDACQRYSHDEKIGLFWRILTNEGDEELYHQELQTIARLLNSLTKVDVESGNQGVLTKDAFKTVLSEYFSSWDEEKINTLISSAETELDSKEAETLDYKALFTEEDDGKTGPFLDTIKRIQREDRLAYVAEIQTELQDANPVTHEELKRAILSVDPEKDEEQVEKMLMWAFHCDKEKLPQVDPIEVDILIVRLQYGNVKRTGKTT